jgi:hypothetical protein
MRNISVILWIAVRVGFEKTNSEKCRKLRIKRKTLK